MIDIQLFISGVFVNSVSALSAGDLAVLTSMLSSAQNGITDVSVLRVEAGETGSLLTIEVTVEMDTVGVDGRDNEAVTDYITTMNANFVQREVAMWSTLVSNVQSSSTSFRAASAVSLASFAFHNMVLDNAALAAEKPVSFSYKTAGDSNSIPAASVVTVSANSATVSESKALSVTAYGGYGLAALVAIMALVVVARTRKSSAASVVTTASSDANAAVASATVNMESGIKTMPVSEVKSTEYGNLAVEDVLRMIRDEDEMLAKASETGHF
jgi:hypothetical protein